MDHQPTQDECWATFWDRATTALAGIYESGWKPETPLVSAAEAA